MQSAYAVNRRADRWAGMPGGIPILRHRAPQFHSSHSLGHTNPASKSPVGSLGIRASVRKRALCLRDLHMMSQPLEKDDDEGDRRASNKKKTAYRMTLNGSNDVTLGCCVTAEKGGS